LADSTNKLYKIKHVFYAITDFFIILALKSSQNHKISSGKGLALARGGETKGFSQR